MKRITNSFYVYLTIGVVLLTIISFHFLANFSTYWKQQAVQKETSIGETKFELLDYQISSSRCWHGHENEDFYLFSASSTSREDLILFLKEFKPPNSCNAWILFQKGEIIEENWKQAAYLKPSEIALPKNSFAHSYFQSCSFSLTDLKNGKVDGKFQKFSTDGKLFIEQEIKNNINEGRRIVYKDSFRIEQVWKNNILFSVDTIK